MHASRLDAATEGARVHAVRSFVVHSEGRSADDGSEVDRAVLRVLGRSEQNMKAKASGLVLLFGASLLTLVITSAGGCSSDEETPATASSDASTSGADGSS